VTKEQEAHSPCPKRTHSSEQRKICIAANQSTNGRTVLFIKVLSSNQNKVLTRSAKGIGNSFKKGPQRVGWYR